MLEDILFPFTFAPRPEYWLWHAALILGAFLMGLWQAHSIWRNPYNKERLQAVTSYGEAKEPEPEKKEELAAAKTVTEESATASSSDLITESAPPKKEEEGKPEPEPEYLPEPEPEPVAHTKPEPIHLADQEMREDAALGSVFASRPDQVDDLTQIRTLSPRLQRRLNYYGIYRFEQVAKWNETNMREFSERLLIDDQIVREDWPAQARALYESNMSPAAAEEQAEPESPEEVASSLPTEETGTVGGPFDSLSYPPTQQEETVSEEDDSAAATMDIDSELGMIYLEQPENMDDLKQIPGVDDRIERELNALGIFRFEQIARWTEQNINGFAERLRIEVEQIQDERWVRKAKQLSSERAKDALRG